MILWKNRGMASEWQGGRYPLPPSRISCSGGVGGTSPSQHRISGFGYDKRHPYTLQNAVIIIGWMGILAGRWQYEGILMDARPRIPPVIPVRMPGREQYPYA